MSNTLPKWAEELERRNQDNRIMNEIIQDLYAHFERGDERPFAIDAVFMDRYQWHNPQKGETHQGGIDRWLKFIKAAYGIDSRFDHTANKYIFKKLPEPPVK